MSGLAQRVAEGQRLAYYRRVGAHAAYWDQLWREEMTPEYYAPYERGEIPQFGEIFERYLPRDERVLEAGCGTGRVVLGLRARGYQVEGVDYAAETMGRVSTRFPDVPLSVADVCQLPAADETYGAYISLGVVEHRREGPEPFLFEAYRVLKPGGVAILSVPWFNPARRIQAMRGWFRGPVQDGMEFYQYAFRRGEMLGILRAHGFEVVDGIGYNAQMGLEDEVPLISRMYGIGRPGRFLKRWVRLGFLPGRVCGHMYVFVALKRRAGKTGRLG